MFWAILHFMRHIPPPNIEAEKKKDTSLFNLPCKYGKKILCLVSQSCLTLCDPMDCSLPGFSVHGDFPGKNTGVGCHVLLQGIFPTQGSNPALSHYRRILFPSEPPGMQKKILNLCKAESPTSDFEWKLEI